MNILRTFAIGLASIPLMLLLLICIFFLEQILGYYPGSMDGEVARIAYSENKTVEECRKILEVPWPHMGPTASEQRSLCIFEYAGLKKDPSVCEQLMPSDYGLSCIGAAQPPPICMFTDLYQVDWGTFEDNNSGSSSIKDCLKTPPMNDLGKQCCEVAKVNYLKNYNSCSTTPLPEKVKDICFERLAFKLGSSSPCKEIVDASSRSACELYIKYKELLHPIQLVEEKDFQPKQ